MRRKDPLRFPKVGQSVLIECTGLPGGLNPSTAYSFTFDRRGGRIIVHVPGYHMGPDICTPKHPEQETWLDGLHNLMRRSWGCEWNIYDETALETFIEILEPCLESYKVVIG